MIQKIVPHLWYNKEAEEAARFYASVFPDSRIDRVTSLPADSPSGPAGSVTVVEFTLFGQGLMAISAGPHDSFNDAVEESRFLMRVRRKLGPSEKDNFGIVTPDAITGLRDRLLGTIFLVAVFVPLIAMIVGAIVIMNIMLVSVTERTKEIGIRKSLGARKIDILKQFLVEAVTLALIGGAVGILLAWVIGTVVTALVFPTYLSIAAISLALTVSGGAGVISGLFPAWKAARLDPIEALRAD